MFVFAYAKRLFSHDAAQIIKFLEDLCVLIQWFTVVFNVCKSTLFLTVTQSEEEK